MFFLPLFIFVLSWFTITAFAGERSILRRTLHHHSHPNRTLSNTVRTFKLVDLYQGTNFFDQWDFFSSPDPTHANVNYQTHDDAIKKNLAFVEGGTTILAVDDFSAVPVGGNRDSVRISSKKTYNHGLFIADFAAMPHGCSVWPAYWSVGPNWPAGGEIDVVEGVHQGPNNRCTLHTAPGCQMNPDINNQVTSNLVTDVCTSNGNDNVGCSFVDPDVNFYGHQFNLGDGGVFAHLWDNTGITIWHFARNAIPADIVAKQPNPDSKAWGKPAALFPNSNSCDIASHFFDHTLVLDTAICGDLAGPTYQSSGCPGTCAEAIADPANFKFAKWKINYIAVYNS